MVIFTPTRIGTAVRPPMTARALRTPSARIERCPAPPNELDLANLIDPTGRSMEKKVNIHDAKTRLSQLVERVEAGEEIVIARAGRPVARLAPLRSRKARRKLGLLDGCFRIPDDFNAPLPDEVLRRFWGGR